MRDRKHRLGAVVLAGAVLLGSACAAAAPQPSVEGSAPSAPGQGNRTANQRDTAAKVGEGQTAAGTFAGAPPAGVPIDPNTGAILVRGGPETQQPAAATDDRMIVYTTQIALDVDSVSGTVAAVSGLAEGLGGYVSQNNVKVQGDRDFATIVIRVPARAYNQAMDQLRKLGVKVTSENGTTRDVTEEFADLAAQAKNLEASETQLQTLMAQAKTVDEILKVQAQLTQVRGQIERLKGRMNVLQRTSDMATITVTLTPVVPGKPESPKGWDPLRSIQESWDVSTQALVRVLDATLRVAVMSWWVVLLGLLGWVAAVSIHRGRSKPTAPAGNPAA